MQPFHFFTPQSVSFIMLIFVFILLKVTNISKLKFIIIFTFLILSIYLVHVSEAVAFLIFLLFFSFLSKTTLWNVKNALIGSLFGSIIIDLFILFEYFVWPNQLRDSQLNIASVFFLVAPIIIVTILKYRLNKLPKLFTNFIFIKKNIAPYKKVTLKIRRFISL